MAQAQHGCRQVTWDSVRPPLQPSYDSIIDLQKASLRSIGPNPGDLGKVGAQCSAAAGCAGSGGVQMTRQRARCRLEDPPGSYRRGEQQIGYICLGLPGCIMELLLVHSPSQLQALSRKGQRKVVEDRSATAPCHLHSAVHIACLGWCRTNTAWKLSVGSP